MPDLVRAADLRTKANIEPELLEMLERFFADRAVGHRQKRIERFEHDDFRAQATPHAAEFETDDACADDA